MITMEPARLQVGDEGFRCPACGAEDFQGCNHRKCPIPGSPKYDPKVARYYRTTPDAEHHNGPTVPGKYFVWITERKSVTYHPLLIEAESREDAFRIAREIYEDDTNRPAAATVHYESVHFNPVGMRRSHLFEDDGTPIEKKWDRPVVAEVKPAPYVPKYK